MYSSQEGYAQFVYPNYNSFFEGHYALAWIPYMSKSFAKLWVRLWKRNPDFIDTLQFLTEKDARHWANLPGIEVLDFGEGIFEERMTGNTFSAWAGLSIVKRGVTLLRSFGAAKFCTKILLKIGAYTPIILTLRKRDC